MNDKEIENGFHLIISNSKTLLVEAKLLLNNGYPARAYTLAQLSIEEAGKSILLCKAIIDYYHGQEINFKYFEDIGFRKHQEKTKQSLKPELIAIWMFENSRKEKTNLRDGLIDDFKNINGLNNLKNDSLYVSIKDDGFVSPKQVFSSDMTSDLIEKAEIRLAAAEPLFRSLDVMKEAAERLKEAADNPDAHATLIQRLSEEFGIDLS